VGTFHYLTPTTYWALVVIWCAILFFCVRRLWRRDIASSLLSVLLIVLTIDALRTLFESVYFGARYSAFVGWLPQEVYDFLNRPEIVFLPKAVHLLAAIAIFAIILRRWLPREEQELLRMRDYASQLKALVDARTQELRETNEALHRDIERRIEVETALKENQRAMATLLSNLPGLAYRCLNTPDYPMTFTSEGCLALTGYTVEQIGPGGTINYGDLVIPEDRQAVWDGVQEGVNNRRTFTLTYRIRTADAVEKWVWEQGCGIFNAEGELEALEGFITDVTARKRAEEERSRLEAQVQQAQKLESLGVLAGGIAHDFNNLLVGILGNADLALDELGPSSPARATVQEIVTAAKRAAELTRQLLAYSGKGRFIIGPVDINDLVREMAHLLDVSISKKALLRYNFASGLPAVMADASQIRQIVMNLIVNASEALEEKSGAIVITTGVMQCDRDYLKSMHLDEDLPDGLYVYFEVSDTGCGMDAETRDRIFDPFFTTKFTGRGLGLAAVLGIVRGHNGAIKVYSEPGRGTTFKVLLPAVETPAACGHEPHAVTGGAWRGSGTILLVDDEPTVRALGTRILQRAGFEVITARDGREAVDLFRAQPDTIVCVLLDLTMPRLGGEDAYRELRRIRPDVCVVLSSGYNEQEVSQRFAGKKLAGFIQKPYRAAVLLETIRRALESPGDTAIERGDSL